jgi:anti-anti-sigma factor
MIRLGAGTMEVEAREGSVCISLRGEFDLMNVPQLADALETAVGRRPRQVVLDLEHTSFIDARMLRLLVDLQQSVTSRGGTLTLGASHNVRRLLGVVGLSDIFHLTDGCPAAVG